MNRILLLILVLSFTFGVFAQGGGQNVDFSQFGVTIEPDKRLIVVLASLEAAGIKTPLTDSGVEFRRQLQTDLAEISPDLRLRMVNFITQYKKRYPNLTDAQIIAPFVSMAYTLTPVPDLDEPIRTADLPGDLLEVLDYSPLLRQFYRQANLGQKLDGYYKKYVAVGDELRPSTSLMVGQLLDYLNTRPQLSYTEKVKTNAQSTKGTKRKLIGTETRERERRFFIVPEILAPAGTINFVNARDDYFAIAPPGTDLSTSEVRRAYLQFVLDPVVLKNAESIFEHRAAIKSLLDERRKSNPNISPDFVLAVSRSLVAAVDARQLEYDRSRFANFQARQKIAELEREDERLKKEGKFDAAQRDALKKEIVAKLNDYNRQLSDETAVYLSDAYESGAVLVFHFAEKLKSLEDSGFDLTESVGNMIAAVDATKEVDRIAQFAEARKRGIAERELRKTLAANQQVTVQNPLTIRLLEIDLQIKSNKFSEARGALEQLLTSDLVAKNPQEKARVYYSLGLVESRSAESAGEDIEERNIHLVAAQEAYSNVIKFKTAETDPAFISLSYVALARIYEFNDQNEYAVKVYEAAINIGDVAGGAFKEAVAARNRLLKP